jgi:hypothetical protein
MRLLNSTAVNGISLAPTTRWIVARQVTAPASFSGDDACDASRMD